MVNSETRAFYILLFTCMYKDRWNKDEARLRRLADIVLLKWNINQGWIEDFIKDNYSEFNGSKFTIDKYASHVPERVRLRLFILCMDIISAGNPIGEREGIVIARLRDALRVEDQDFEKIMWFCRNRNNAVNIIWEKSHQVR